MFFQSTSVVMNSLFSFCLVLVWVFFCLFCVWFVFVFFLFWRKGIMNQLLKFSWLGCLGIKTLCASKLYLRSKDKSTWKKSLQGISPKFIWTQNQCSFEFNLSVSFPLSWNWTCLEEIAIKESATSFFFAPVHVWYIFTETGQFSLRICHV